MKRSLGAGEWIRKGIGAAMLLGVLAISLGLDTGVLARISTIATGGIEQKLVDRFAGNGSSASAAGNKAVASAPAPGSNGAVVRAAEQAEPLPVEGELPSLSGAVQWLNSPPLTVQGLRGKVVVIDFWTYSCINCLRALPYVQAWAQKYRDQGLVVIGVHAPEFAFERNVDNVKKAVHDLGIDYPVAIDNNYAIWRAFGNQYWPAHYFIDAQGRIRYHHFGEGEYAQSEQVIQQLLKEAGHSGVASATSGTQAQGVMAAADNTDMLSPETYIGYERADNFASPGGESPDRSHAAWSKRLLGADPQSPAGLHQRGTVQGESGAAATKSGSGRQSRRTASGAGLVEWTAEMRTLRLPDGRQLQQREERPAL